MKRWEANNIDIEISYLEVDLDEDIYMRDPEGYYNMFENNDEDKALEILTPIYGLVQVARQFLNKMIFILTIKLNFKAGKIDPWFLSCST